MEDSKILAGHAVPMDIPGTIAPREEEQGRVDELAREAGEDKEKGLGLRVIGREASTWVDPWKESTPLQEPD